jgi:hypothetical protein
MSKVKSWQDTAKAKRDEVLNLIPFEWRLPTTIPTAEQVRDPSAGYIQQFLSRREIEITETDAVDIVKQTSSGNWTAEEVVKAFAHRASLAHQIVRDLFILLLLFIIFIFIFIFIFGQEYQILIIDLSPPLYLLLYKEKL